ncbi:MAG: alpha/beta fold hydrolase [Pseudomonadota bacterium]
MLSQILHDGPDGTPLLIAHGLYGSARNWGVIAKRLSDRGPVIVVDMRNHGASDWHSTHSYADLAGDLAETLESIGEPSDVLGHSMGGKAAMVLALTRPDLVRKLVVADIAPVAYKHTQQGMIDAMRGVDLSGVEKRSDADVKLAKTVEDQGVRAFLLQSLDVAQKRWRLNLDVLSAEMDKIIGFPQLTGAFEGPALFLSGGMSDYVLPEHRPQIKSIFPNAKFAKIPGAGHWLHAEKPREFEAAVRAYLDQA